MITLSQALAISPEVKQAPQRDMDGLATRVRQSRDASHKPARMRTVQGIERQQARQKTALSVGVSAKELLRVYDACAAACQRSNSPTTGLINGGLEQRPVLHCCGHSRWEQTLGDQLARRPQEKPNLNRESSKGSSAAEMDPAGLVFDPTRTKMVEGVGMHGSALKPK